MSSLLIRGGIPLAGTVELSGSKNAVLPMLAACVVFQGPVQLSRCPNLTDVDAAVAILTHCGAKVRRSGQRIVVDPRPIHTWDIPRELMCAMRGSVCFAGSLLARFGTCRLTVPGGCPLGQRPVDFHAMGFRALGAGIDESGVVSGNLSGAEIHLPYPSVGATENLILAALGAAGTTTIQNAAREPEIVCLCDFLRRGGCNISGDGTSVVTVSGGLPQSASMEVMADRMEAATFACAVASAGGQIGLRFAEHRHLTPVLQVLAAAGCTVIPGDEGLYLRCGNLTSPGTIVTAPYPGFPTDAQAPILAALLKARGTTVVQEQVFSDRMHHVKPLKRLGADITLRENTATIRGVEVLHGGWVEAVDLRGAAALAVAALGAEGITQIDGIRHLHRGYEAFAKKLRALGAEITECP